MERRQSTCQPRKDRDQAGRGESEKIYFESNEKLLKLRRARTPVVYDKWVQDGKHNLRSDLNKSDAEEFCEQTFRKKKP